MGSARTENGRIDPPLRGWVAFALPAVLLIAVSSPLRAQTNLETNAGIQFNFATPGAGNLALGGAFIALAFDASAAYTNPAGLTVISAPETLIEARHWRHTHVFTDRGRLQGEPSDDPLDFDDHAGLVDGRVDNEVTGLSYLSYVYPRGDWSFAVFRHELVNFEADFSTSGAYVLETRSGSALGIPGSGDGRLAALQNRMSLDIVAYGTAVAYRVGRGFSIGAAASYFDFTIDSLAQRYIPDFNLAPDFSPDRLVNFQTQKGSDHGWGLSGGFLWRSPRDRWSVGGVYRQGPDFIFQTRSEDTDAALQPFEPAQHRAPFHVPDVYGLGFAFQPRDDLRLAFDYNRVLYSRLTQGFVDIFDLPRIAPGQPLELDRFVIDDADELHLGAEYSFLQRWPVLNLRAGVWHDPDHSLRYEGSNPDLRAIFRPRGDQVHYTAGAGLALRKVQIDMAIDYSDRLSVIAISGGFRH